MWCLCQVPHSIYLTTFARSGLLSQYTLYRSFIVQTVCVFVHIVHFYRSNCKVVHNTDCTVYLEQTVQVIHSGRPVYRCETWILLAGIEENISGIGDQVHKKTKSNVLHRTSNHHIVGSAVAIIMGFNLLSHQLSIAVWSGLNF